MADHGKIAMTMVDELSDKIKRDVVTISRSKYYSTTSDGTQNDLTYQSKHIVLDDCFGITLAYGNFYLDDRTTDLAPFDLNVAVYVNGVRYPIFFNNGDTSKHMALGAFTYSDTLPINLKKGDEVFASSHVLQGAGEKHPRGLTLMSNVKEGRVVGDATTGSTLSTPIAGEYYGYAPLAMYSTLTPSSKSFKTLGIIGSSSSVGVGRGNHPWNGSPAGELGYLQIAALEAGWGYVTAGMNGQKASDFVEPAKARSRLEMLKNCDLIAVQYVSNDLSTASVTFEKVRDDLLAIHRRFWDMGIPTFQMTVNPRTNSTDKWATLENQTPINDNFAPGPNSARGKFNRWVMDNEDGIVGIDCAPGWESSPESGLWGIDPVKTGDGIHPNRAGHEGYAMESVRDYLLNWEK